MELDDRKATILRAIVEEYVRTGKPLRIHQTMTDEEWGTYQRGMRSGVAMNAHWVARHLSLPRSARHIAA